MRIKIPCARCGAEFEPKSDVHIYCSNKCRNDEFNELNKKNREDEPETFPMYRFPKCGHLIKLDFDPRKNKHSLNNLICKECNQII